MSKLSTFIDDMAASDDLDERIWSLWQTRTHDTVDIAAALGVNESVVANRLLHAREKQRARGQVVGTNGTISPLSTNGRDLNDG